MIFVRQFSTKKRNVIDFYLAGACTHTHVLRGNASALGEKQKIRSVSYGSQCRDVNASLMKENEEPAAAVLNNIR